MPSTKRGDEQTGSADSLPLRQLPYCLGNLRQLRVGGAALQPQPVIDGGSAADHGSGGNVVGDAALRDGDGSVADLDVAGDADLSGEKDIVADVGCAGHFKGGDGAIAIAQSGIPH